MCGLFPSIGTASQAERESCGFKGLQTLLCARAEKVVGAGERSGERIMEGVMRDESKDTVDPG